jgi:alpha-1,3-rhamnosyl/mannosyltransferase
MRIGLDIRYANDHFPGIGRYVVNLARALAALDHPHTLVLLYNPALPNTRYDLRECASSSQVELVATTARPFSLAEQLQLPRLARRLRLDVLHSPYYIKPYGKLPCPSVVTVYDLIARLFPHVVSWRGRALFNLTMGLALRTADRVLTISRSARKDIVQYMRVPRERITITPLAADQRFSPQPHERIEEVRAHYNLPPRYVLYLGSNKPHKNLERLVAAWERFTQEHKPPNDGPGLVLAGHYDPHYPAVRQMVRERGLSRSVVFVPDVAEEDMPALYSGAELFVFPSLYEGFGLPPLEAMACGVPVLCSSSSSLPEVVGDAALTVNPYGVTAIAEGLQQLLSQATLRAHLREAGLQRAREFSWERTARATLAVYEDVQRER